MGWLGDNWVALSALFIAAVTFVQRQSDRRVARRERAEQQARRVTMGVHEDWVPTGPHSRELEGWSVEVRNDSDLPVHIGSVAYVWADPWEILVERGQREFHFDEPQVVAPYFLKPEEAWTQSVDVHNPGTPDGTGGGNPDFVWLRFRDQQGTMWERRSDTNEFRRERREIRWWQKVIQRLAMRVPVEKVLIMPFVKRAIAAAHKVGPNHLPRSLRIVRWLWGYWPVGERDPWMKPDGAPVLWGFGELPWTRDDMGHPENT